MEHEHTKWLAKAAKWSNAATRTLGDRSCSAAALENAAFLLDAASELVAKVAEELREA